MPSSHGGRFLLARLQAMNSHFEVIVVGLGAMGSAAAYQLAKRGRRVLGLDRFSPPHALGSSHGDSRIIRQAIGEGVHYTPLALRAYELWREIEAQSGEELLTCTGGLIISSGARQATTHVPHFFDNTLAAARRFGIRHELLDARQIRKRFPQFKVRDDEVGYYEYDAGYLRPERCVSAQLSLAAKCGATLHRDERVVRFSQANDGIRVLTDCGQYEARHLVLCAGPWIGEFLAKERSRLFTVTRQALFWFDVNSPLEGFEPPAFPIFIWELQDRPQVIYGFPAIDGPRGGVKVATEQYENATTGDCVDRDISLEEVRRMHESFVAPYLPALSNRCVKAMACLYTVTPDFHFVVDSHPDLPNVIIASPCSGHGFKHSAALGEALAELVIDGRSKIDVSAFAMTRFKGGST